MKNNLLKLVAGATLIAAMVVGLAVNKMETKSSLFLANLSSEAVAYDETMEGGYVMVSQSWGKRCEKGYWTCCVSCQCMHSWGDCN